MKDEPASKKAVAALRFRSKDRFQKHEAPLFHHLSPNIPEREAEPRIPLPRTEKGPPEGDPFYLFTYVVLGDFPR
ncbi:hypothetical protein, partial [Pseudophaeobacter sp.]|uniref:hypothetical protein n=1 Tax=Pseudophaeobacter sp. TaxID=1971739 RepID=UPI0032998FA9